MYLWKNKKVLITGIAGFVGSNLAKNLVKEGCDLRIVDNLERGKLYHIQSIIDSVQFINIDIYMKNIDEKEKKSSFFICEGKNSSNHRCSYIYKRNLYKDQYCPICKSSACIDIHKEKLIDIIDVKLTTILIFINIFFYSLPEVLHLGLAGTSSLSLSICIVL